MIYMYLNVNVTAKYRYLIQYEKSRLLGGLFLEWYYHHRVNNRLTNTRFNTTRTIP